MKKSKYSNPITKFALFAGALALMAGKSEAQTSVDALLNKLEQKGVLTVDEAKQLKADNATNSVADINKVVNGKFTTPDWVSNYKFSGDVRFRYDQVSSDLHAFKSSGAPANDLNNNIRFRYRLRAGVVATLKDDVQAGFRIGSDDTGKGADAASGNPLSNNSTLLGNASKKPLWVDAAYGKWTPINDSTWMLSSTIGKMDNPFMQSGMVFDPDYTPEGAALQASYKFDNNNTFLVNGGGFVIDQINSRGPYLVGGQGIWNSTWSPHLASSVGGGGYAIGNLNQVTGLGLGATPYDSNLGNSMAGSQFLAHFNPYVFSGSVTYTLDSFPLYVGAFPIKLGGEYMRNPAANGQNEGWWGGVTLGKSGKRGTWDLMYRYQKLQKDAWWDQIVDDDNIATFPTSTTAGTAAGGTNIKGNEVKFNYSILDSLTFSFTAYDNTLIQNPVAGAKTGALHVMADLMWKF